MSYIDFLNVNKSFGSNHVLRQINLSVEKGQLATLLGPSGCGKSTLLRCLAGLEEVSTGSMHIDGEDITVKNPKDRNIGMVFQQYSLFPNMTVRENIAFGLKLRKMPGELIEEKVSHVIDLVDLKGKVKEYPHALSGGQQQRVALARSLVMEPKVLLLDEPLSALDAKLRKSLQAEIKKIHNDTGITMIFVTHDQDEAMILSDVIHLFRDGQIEQSGAPTHLYTQPRTRYAAEFIGHYNVLDKSEFDRMIEPGGIGGLGSLTDAAASCVSSSAASSDASSDAASAASVSSAPAGTGTAVPDVESVAIRPETIEIMPEDSFGNRVLEHNPAAPDRYLLPATVIDSTPHGNVLRYTLDVRGTRLHADILFRSFTLYPAGHRLTVSVEKRNCLELKA